MEIKTQVCVIRMLDHINPKEWRLQLSTPLSACLTIFRINLRTLFQGKNHRSYSQRPSQDQKRNDSLICSWKTETYTGEGTHPSGRWCLSSWVWDRQLLVANWMEFLVCLYPGKCTLFWDPNFPLASWPIWFWPTKKAWKARWKFFHAKHPLCPRAGFACACGGTHPSSCFLCLQNVLPWGGCAGNIWFAQDKVSNWTHRRRLPTVLGLLALHWHSFLDPSVLKAECLHVIQSKSPSYHNDLGGCPRDAPAPCVVWPPPPPLFISVQPHQPPHCTVGALLFLFFAGRLCPKISAWFSSPLLSGLYPNTTSEIPSPKSHWNSPLSTPFTL